MNKIFPFILVVLASCTYSLTEDSFVTVLEPTERNTTISEDLSLSDLFIYRPTTLYKEFAFNQESIISTQFMVGDVFVPSSFINDRIEVLIDPADFASGNYTLTGSVTVKTGSNSLADKLDAELYTIEFNEPVAIDLEPPSEVLIESISIDNGRLKLDWEKPAKKNFIGYNIIRSYLDPTSQYGTVDTVFIEQNDIASAFDLSYVGGNAEYNIDIVGYDFYVQGVRAEIAFEPYFIEYSFNSENELQFNWDFILYGQDIEVTISSDIENPLGKIKDRVRPSKQDFVTSDDKPTGFGQSFEVSFAVSSIDNSYTYHTDTLNIYRGTQINPADQFVYYPSKNEVISIKNYRRGNTSIFDSFTVYKYHATSLSLIDSLNYENSFDTFIVYGIVVSPDGYWYLEERSNGKALYNFDPNTLVFDPNDILISFNSNDTYKLLKNNKIFIFDSFQDKSFLRDLGTLESLLTLDNTVARSRRYYQINEDYTQLYMSPRAGLRGTTGFFYDLTETYELDLKAKINVEESEPRLFFDFPTDEEMLFIGDRNSFIANYDLNQSPDELGFIDPTFFYDIVGKDFSIDFESQLLGFNNYPTYEILDMSSKNTIFTTDIWSERTDFFLTPTHIISKNGFFMEY